MPRAWVRLLCALAILFNCQPGWTQTPNISKTLQLIQKHQLIRIGVKTDVPPYDSINSKGEIVGYESDLAEDIANRLDVKLLKVGITTENRFEKLELGDVDMLIATIGDTPSRREVATGIEPGYFETGVSILLRPDKLYTGWSQIRGETICALQGSYFNRPISERYLISLQSYRTVRDALLALKDGHCAGFLYSTPAIQEYLSRPEFANYHNALPSTLTTPWAIYIARSERGTDYEKKIGDIAADWQRTGLLLELGKKWDTGSISWLMEQHNIWSKKLANGHYECERLASGNWPSECRKSVFINSEEATGLQAFGLWLKEQTGLDLNFVYDPYDRSQFVQGFFYTMLLISLSIIFSLIVGVATSIASDQGPPKLKKLISAIMAYGRLNPPLLLMYLLFFGLGGWMLANWGYKLSAMTVAVFCLGYYTAGLVMSALLEAANHIRISQPQFKLSSSTILDTLDYSSWPIRQSLINLTKQSMIASAIAIPELLSATNLVMAEKGNIFLLMTVLLITFYFITSFWVSLFNWLSKKLHQLRYR